MCSSDLLAVRAVGGEQEIIHLAETHLAGIEELFTGRFEAVELDTLAELLTRLPRTAHDCSSDSCTP